MTPAKKHASIEKLSALSNRKRRPMIDRMSNRVKNMSEQRIQNHIRSNWAENTTLDRVESHRRSNLIESMALDQIENNGSRRRVENMDETQVENEKARRSKNKNRQRRTNPLNEAWWGNIDQFDVSKIIEEKKCHSKVVLPSIPQPPNILKELFTGHDERAKQYRKSIRKYNAALAFSSLVVQHDKELANVQGGVNILRINRKLHHKIDPLLQPTDKYQPSFAKQKNYDGTITGLQMQMALDNSVGLDSFVLYNLMEMLHNSNPYVKQFLYGFERMRTRRDDYTSRSNHCSVNIRRYNSLTIPEVAVIIPQSGNGQNDNEPARKDVALQTENVVALNNRVTEMFYGEEKVHLSADIVINEQHEQYVAVEYLNTINVSVIPPHILRLKIEMAVLLIRDIDQVNNLCNGTRLIIIRFQPRILDCEIASSGNAKQRVFIPRIPFIPSHKKFSMEFKRVEFLVISAFAMPINKS
ncbi:unnamed protein product [Lepeophtheirus salmonis]|uniref:(salmon louse) hypothetical protein n=2 Tax=Lepeophtheirus salmonis TaxID=72036 RepID=A0A7R8CP00_LEPSM|nr:unnamed protein product [Lepeophtheirus salmonis]CAF2880809.1 unnamed protein product [Lepeophtheirus salmonis]